MHHHPGQPPCSACTSVLVTSTYGTLNSRSSAVVEGLAHRLVLVDAAKQTHGQALSNRWAEGVGDVGDESLEAYTVNRKRGVVPRRGNVLGGAGGTLMFRNP